MAKAYMVFDFVQANKEIEANSSLIEQTNQLVNLVIDQKKFVFSKTEVDLDLSFLKENDVIEIEGDIIRLGELDLLSYLAYRAFAEKLGYQLSNDLLKLFEFLEAIRDHFDSGKTQGITRFLRGLDAIAVFYHHQNHTVDVVAFLESLDDTQKDWVYSYSEAFSHFIQHHQFKLSVLLNLLRWLYSFHKYDEPGVANLNVARLREGLQQLGEIQPAKAHELLPLLLENFDGINEDISVNMLIGLLKQDHAFFSRLQDLAKNETYQPAVLVVLATKNVLHQDEITEVIRLISDIKNDNKKYRLQLPKLYGSIIANPAVSDSQIRTKCFNLLEELIVDPDPDFPFAVMSELRFMSNNEAEKTALLKMLLLRNTSTLFFVYMNNSFIIIELFKLIIFESPRKSFVLKRQNKGL
ncbi:MAG: hypothetical protein EOP48_07485, partial [Sphingobacteriales bacterium]